MTTKKPRTNKTPALSTQLKTAAATIDALNKKIEQLDRNHVYEAGRAKEFLNELNAVHTLLDAMPNPPPRVAEMQNIYGSRSEDKVSASVRVSVLLATRGAA